MNGLDFHPKKNKNPKEDEYTVTASLQGKKVGYFYFSERHQNGEVILKGIYIDPEFRGRNYAGLYLDEMERLAKQKGFGGIKTIPQAKPLTCKVLQSCGYSPTHELSEGKRVYVGRVLDGQSDLTGLFLEHPGRRQALLGSNKLIHSQRILVVNSISSLISPVSITLNARYQKKI